MSKDKSWWATLRSMKLGLYLILTIIAASIAGTVVPQRQAHGPEGWLNSFLHLNDIYHSWWYIGLLGLLTLNLVACSFYRFKTIRGSFSRSYPLLDKEQLARLKACTAFRLTGELEEVKNRIINILLRRGYEVRSVSLDGKCRIGARHGRWAVWGSFITHLSFVVIIAGLLIGATWGYQGSINAPVGTTFDVSSVPGINPRALKDDFQVRVDEFWIEHYPNGEPSGYLSRLTVLENNREMQTTTLGVNSPLNYKGTKFYQARYGNAIEIQVNGPDARTIYQGFVIEGESFQIPQTNFIILARVDKNRTAASTSGPTEASNPKIIYALFQDGRRTGMGAAETGATIDPGQGGNSFKFVGTAPYTGLQVKKDPGVPWIWLGSVFMLLGMGISFFVQRRHLWMELEEQDGMLVVHMGGRANKNGMILENHIKDLVNAVQAGSTTTSCEPDREEEK